MLSFDISIIDLTMLVAILVLFALYATSRQKEKPSQETLNQRMSRKRIERSRNMTPRENNHYTDNPNGHTLRCQHQFGFLKKRKNKTVPDECVGCEELVNCMLPNE